MGFRVEVRGLLVLLFLTAPFAALLYQRWRDQRDTERWNTQARELGLNSGGVAPRLTLSGDFRGVFVEVEHRVWEGYKQQLHVNFVARADLEDLARSRDIPKLTRDNELVGDLVDGWFECSGRGLFGSGQLERDLAQLLAAAHHAVKTSRS